MSRPEVLLQRIAVILFFVSTLASAQTYTVLYDYPETNRNNTGVFSQVFAQGRDANLYSTISNGGANSVGTAYQMTLAGQLTTLYSFCSLSGCSDGSNPLGGLSLGFDGNFYGTTQGGGTGGAGTVFQLTPEGALHTLYTFGNKNDDSAPTYTLLLGQDGNFYGVSEEQYNGQDGTFFKITPSGKFVLLHDFVFTDGSSPNLPTQGTDGNFYGTALFGGSSNLGVVYKLTPSGAITVLHNFTGYGNGDGSYPVGILVQGSDGNFYGTTKEGGAHNQGTVFKISATGTYTLLYSFNYNAQTFDGQLPVTGLTLGTDGNLYGTTAEGGKNGNTGTIFQITPAGQEKILYNFCSQTGCADGLAPEGPLVQHTDGKFFGTTTGNSIGGSVFYSLDMGLKPFVNLLNWEGVVTNTIEILGQGLTNTTQVSFNGTPATFNVVSDTYMTAVVPAGATTGNITATTSAGTLKSNRKFLVTPQIKTFAPTSGPVGTVVTINGESLTQTKGVGFGDYIPGKFTVNSDQQITATVPEGAMTGPVGVETAGGIAIFGKFTVTPAVLSFTPMQGPVGTTVTINGTSFTGATKVTFGGVAASSFQVVSDIVIKAIVPNGAVTGPIAVTTSSGTGVSSQNFTVTQ
ncbi:MAG TPA: choice-of-anchor tandem repeat GloVer-containing protein [Terriglobales bacterium]|nr:choice-of-anchor tandem repeat GloVer-containing protein [Terriglobales bacterium]